MLSKKEQRRRSKKNTLIFASSLFALAPAGLAFIMGGFFMAVAVFVIARYFIEAAMRGGDKI